MYSIDGDGEDIEDEAGSGDDVVEAEEDYRSSEAPARSQLPPAVKQKVGRGWNTGRHGDVDDHVSQQLAA
jgi:hypothetical protein